MCILHTYSIVGVSKYLTIILMHRELQRDVVYLGRPIAPSYTSPNAEEGGCGVSANEYSCAQEPKETLEI